MEKVAGSSPVGSTNSSRSDAAGNSTSYTYYSTDGRLFSETDPLGGTIYHGYDHVGREVRTWGSATNPVECAFGIYGDHWAMRTFRATSPSFSTSAWPLSDDGSDPQTPTPASWSVGDKTTWNFDAGSGLISGKEDAASHLVSFSYKQNGSLATRTWSRGVVTTYSYDPNTGDQTGISYSDGTPSLTYVYDRLGHRTSAVQAYSGLTLTTGLQYNVPGKLTQENLDPAFFAGRQLVVQLDTTDVGKLGRTIGYEIGTSSNPTLDQNSSFGYDPLSRLNSVGLSGGPTFSYGFTANSNLISGITDSSDNWGQTRFWDPNRDLLDSIQTSIGSTVQGSFNYVYDKLGRRTSKLESGALFARYSATALVDAYTYDSKSEVIGDQAYQSNNQTTPTTPVLGRGFTFAYDLIGNRTTSSVDTQQTTYTSNNLNQITSRTVPGYYPASGFAPSGATVTLNGTAIPTSQFTGQYYLLNVTANNSAAPLWLTAQSSSSLGGSVTANAFLPQTPENPTYDNDGNVLTDGRWNYFWDAENRLKAIETYGNQSGNTKAVWNSGVPLIHLDFKYDYQGRRISKAVSAWSGTAFVASSETRYAYEGWNLIADYSVSGSALALTHSYLWGIDLSGTRHKAGGVGGLLTVVTSSGAMELPVYDSNGNIHGLTDRQTGQLTAVYEYSPFGQPLRVTGFYAQTNPFRFSSKYNDTETDLVYYGRRYYNPSPGRFLGRDPKDEKGGLHLYGFAGNNGINRWDYLGLDGTNDYLSANWTSQYLASLGLDPNGNIDQAEVQRNQQEAGRSMGKANSGALGGSAGILSGVSEIAGSGDFFQQSDNGFNPIADNLGIGTVYQTNSTGQWGYGTSTGKNFSANTSLNDAISSTTLLPTVYVNSTRDSLDKSTTDAVGAQLSKYITGPSTAQYFDIYLKYTDAKFTGSLASHSFVVGVNDTTGQAYATRAGPSGAGVSLTDPVWGPIFAQTGRYDAGFKDSPNNVTGTDYIGRVNAADFDPYTYSNAINDENIDYWPQGPNSNSYAFSYLNYIGFPSPSPTKNAPGWDYNLPPPGTPNGSN